MRVRLQDIANDLKLSKMTISKVLRGQTDVSAATKARVLQRAQELGYQPNISARGLRTGQTCMVGVILPGLGDSHSMDICDGILRVIQSVNYGAVVTTTDCEPEREEQEIGLHFARQIDALFLLGHSDPGPHAKALQGAPVPVIWLGGKPITEPAFAVSLNESEVARLPAEYLLLRGARRIAYLRGPRTSIADLRFSGYLKAHQASGTQPRLSHVAEVRPGADEYGSAYAAVDGMLRSQSAPDAVMAYTDTMAAAARDAGLARGLKVPEQFQVVGCGNQTGICSLGLPLTSVDLSGQELGTRAARAAMQSIESRTPLPKRGIQVMPRMVARGTTRPLDTGGRHAKRR